MSNNIVVIRKDTEGNEVARTDEFPVGFPGVLAGFAAQDLLPDERPADLTDKQISEVGEAVGKVAEAVNKNEANVSFDLPGSLGKFELEQVD